MNAIRALYMTGIVVVSMGLWSPPVSAYVDDPHGMDKLTPLVGEWQYALYLEIDNRVQPAARGTTDIRTTLGGQFLELKSIGTEGTTIEALAMIGFDSRDRPGTYFFLSLDELSSGAVESRGVFVEDRNAIILMGTEVDSATGMSYEFETAVHIKDRNRFTITYSALDNARDRTVIASMIYRRCNSEAMLILPTATDIEEMSFEVLQAELSRVSKLRAYAGLNELDRQAIRRVFISLLTAYSGKARAESARDHNECIQNQERAESIEEIRDHIYSQPGNARMLRKEIMKSLDALSD